MPTFQEIKVVNPNDSSAVITHNLGSTAAVLTACTPGGWPGRPYITARDTNTITVTFATSAPPSGSFTLDIECKT